MRALSASLLVLGACGPRVDIVAWMAETTAGNEGGAGGEGGAGVESPCGSAGCPTPRCDDMQCVVACEQGSADCDGDTTNACETNLLTSVANCGACGHACDVPNADSSCVDGECRIAECRGSFQNCGGGDIDGCETNVKSDPLNCGRCGNECSGKDGEPYCVSGQCGVTQCAAGTGACTGDGNCNVDLQSDPLNCGRCGHVCSAAHGATRCVGGECVIGACNAGWADCDGDVTDGGYATGCETSTDTSVDNCGMCGRACPFANGLPTCRDGSCDIVCDAGFGDCNGQHDDGCETDLSVGSHCGECGNICPMAAPACVSAGGVSGCQSTVSHVNDASGFAFDTTLSIDHVLAAGTDRLLLAAVVTESTTGAGFDGARPTSVKYGAVTMQPSGSQSSGAVTDYNPYIYYYYLTEPDLPSSNGETLTITAAANAVDLIAADLIEFTGVDPVNPLLLGTGAALTVASGACAAAGSITTTLPGTALFVVSAVHQAGYPGFVGSELEMPALWAQGAIGSNGFQVWGALGGTDGAVLAPGARTVGFSYEGCNPGVALPIGIVPYRPQ